MQAIPVDPNDAHDAMIYTDGILDYERHDAILFDLGYRFLSLSCTCGGNKDDFLGHFPECGWGRLIAGEGPINGKERPDEDFFFVPMP